MPPRFCPQCGVPAVADAKFCTQCGSGLAGGSAARAESPWQLTAAGSAVLGVFLSAGLAIWTFVLSPAQTKGPGGARPGPAAASAPAAALPEGHPKVPVALPAEVKSFITDLAAKAKDNPRDIETWSKLGQVTYRAAQLDPAYFPQALATFEHVLELDPKNADALRGAANVHYDHDEYKDAIPFYERYLAVRPDDASARTDLGTMYLYAGDATRAIATYKDVIKQNPSFLQAHYNLGVTYHQQGDDAGALAELRTARGLATEDSVRKQIDDMMTTLSGGAAERPATATSAAGDGAPRSPFQKAVEAAFRGHPILGPRIVRFEWSGPGAGRVVVQNFPMDGMPAAVRDKFTAHMGEELRTAQSANRVEGPVRMEIADASSGTVMATLTP